MEGHKTSMNSGLLVEIRPNYDKFGIVQKPITDSSLDCDILYKFV